jgi:hypothetical protein
MLQQYPVLNPSPNDSCSAKAVSLPNKQEPQTTSSLALITKNGIGCLDCVSFL